MKNSEYWLKRAQQLEDAQTKKNIEYFGGELERIYQKAIRDTEKDIARWYTRFARNNGITMAEAKKLLDSRELEEFKWTVEEYIDYGKKNAVSGEWMKQLENASARYHISRLEALKLQMQNHVEVLMGNESDDVTDLMREHLEDGYYRTAFEIQKFVGVGTSFSRLDEDTIEKVLSKPWTSDGTNFSERIWGAHRTELVNDLHKKLTQAIIMGENPKVLAKGFAKYVSDEAAKSIRAKKSRAENLIMTETAYFRSEGQRRCYKELDVGEFENCATLDSRTSEVCRDMDGTHFPVSEMQPGLNCPPFHNRCRTATCPYFNDEFTAAEVRAARAEDGSYYTVPADMTYREWERDFVSGGNIGLQNSDNRDIMGVKNNKTVVDGVKTIGKIDIEIYQCVTKDIKTDEVIITDERVRHIKERHPNDYEQYFEYAKEILAEPDYILEANKPNTALILKEFFNGAEQFKTILRLVTSTDNEGYKNSIITFMKINEKEWKRLLRNKKILYKSE